MQARILALAALVLLPTPIWAVAVMFSAVSGQDLDWLAADSLQATVTIHDRLAVTRTERVFTNRLPHAVEAVFEFRLLTRNSCARR
jgi:hypothetical protein